MMALRIRMGTFDDVPILAGIMHDCLLENPMIMGGSDGIPSLERCRDYVFRSVRDDGVGGQRCVVAEINGRSVGFTRLIYYGVREKKGEFYPSNIVSFYVVSSARGSGVGKTLLLATMRVAAEEGHWWPVTADSHISNTEVRRLFSRVGMDEICCMVPTLVHPSIFVDSGVPLGEPPSVMVMEASLPEGWRRLW